MSNVIPLPLSPAARSVADVAARARSVSLDDVLERAALQVREDRKYLVAAGDLDRLAEELAGRLDVLEIDGRRCFDYESRYFDTPSRQTYREHVAGRRDRFKVRTRSYLDSGETMFEVKLEGAGGGTRKRRFAHPFGARDRITPSARRHLAAVLAATGRRAPCALAPACLTSYRRTTFVLRDGSARITCDHGLTCANARASARGLDDHVLVEVKSAAGESVVDHALAALGIAPVSLSKYRAGLAVLHPELPAGSWTSALERCFDHAPALRAA